MEIEEENTEVFWEKLLKKIREKIRIKRIRVNKEGRERWWDGECRMKKKEVRKIFKEWRKGRKEREEYKTVKRELQRIYDRKKEERKEKLLEEARRAKTQKEVWEVINKERGKRIEINEEIEMCEWEEYFRKMLGGSRNRGGMSGEAGEERERGRGGREGRE